MGQGHGGGITSVPTHIIICSARNQDLTLDGWMTHSSEQNIGRTFIVTPSIAQEDETYMCVSFRR